jgi:replicative DNA helicase
MEDTNILDNQLLQAAQVYLQKGWSIFPVNSGGEYDKRPHLSLLDTGHSKEDNGKTRPSWKSLMVKRPTEDNLRTWFMRSSGKGLALVTGSLSGVIVLDFDGDEGSRLVEQLALRPHVQTGSGGYHVYFQHPGHSVRTLNSKAKQELGQRWSGLDIRADGGYAILPPSRNNRGEYRQLRSFDELENVSSLPCELAQFLGLVKVEAAQAAPQVRLQEMMFLTATGMADRAHSDRLLFRALDIVHSGKDSRNNTGHWLACQLRDNRFSKYEAEEVMRDYAARVPPTDARGQVAPYTLSEALTTLSGVFSTPPREPSVGSTASMGKAVSFPRDGQVSIADQPSSSITASLPDVGEVFVVPASLLPEIEVAILALKPSFTVRSPQKLETDYLTKLREDGRPLYVMSPTQELVRRLDRAGVEWHAIRAQLPGKTLEDTLERLEMAASEVIEEQVRGDASFLLDVFPQYLDARAGRHSALYPLGFPQIDVALGGGLYPGLHVLGGVTAGGKTALALHIAQANAQLGRPVLFVTYEQSKAELWSRIISPRVSIPLGAFRLGERHGRSLGTYLQAQEGYQELAQNVAAHLRVFEGDGSSGAQQWGVSRISAEVRRLRALYDQSPLVILDYLQRMPSEIDSDKRHKVDDVVMSLQVRLGRQEQTPILLLSSVSRGNYGELLTRPLDERLAVFKESGNIEYTAYSAMLVYPLTASNAAQLGLPPAPVPGTPSAKLQGSWRYIVLDLVKNREGEAGLQLAVKWWPGQSRYEVVGPLDIADLPLEFSNPGRRSYR